MAALSDQLLVVAIMAYLVAMICHAAEYAIAGRVVPSRPVARRARPLVRVGAGAGGGIPHRDTDADPDGGVPAATPVDAGPVDAGQAAGQVPLVGRIAVLVTLVAVAVHLAVVTTRGIAADRLPFGNMYEYVLSATLVGAVAWLVVLRRWPALRRLGLFVSLAMVLLLGVAGVVIYTPIVPLVPALNSYWFEIHITTIVIASGLLLVGAVPAVMYLIRDGYERGRRGFPYTLGQRVPAADVLERLTFRLHAFAFPIWTFAVMAGAVWAEAAWGRYWGWDPKETWAFISWVVYAGYLHARATPSVRRNVATWIAVLGFLTILMNLFGVNLFIDGLHSYSGVE